MTSSSSSQLSSSTFHFPPSTSDHSLAMPSPGLSSQPNGSSNHADAKTNAQHETNTHPGPDTQPRNETSLADIVTKLHTQVQTFLSQSFLPGTTLSNAQIQTKRSLEIISTARNRYSLEELSLSYNGGKDCLVLLVLFLACLYPLPSPSPSIQQGDDAGTEDGDTGRGKETLETIPAIYALPPDPFESVEDFVAYSARTFHLTVHKYTTSPPESTLRSCFEDYLNVNPRIKAIFVGTRRTDPHGAKLTHFDRTDRGWPDFVRINPMLDWHYAEIWAFIRFLDLRYCDLYDQGYTSLGGRNDTHPNPKLTMDAEGRYRPAYELTEDLEERLGRD